MSNDQAAAYFKLLMDFNVVPMATWSYDGGFLTANDALLDLIGYTRQELEAGRINWKSLTPPKYLPLDEDCMRQLETRPVAEPYVKEYIRKDGSRVTVKLFNGRDMNVPRQGVVTIIRA